MIVGRGRGNSVPQDGGHDVVIPQDCRAVRHLGTACVRRAGPGANQGADRQAPGGGISVRAGRPWHRDWHLQETRTRCGVLRLRWRPARPAGADRRRARPCHRLRTGTGDDCQGRAGDRRRRDRGRPLCGGARGSQRRPKDDSRPKRQDHQRVDQRRADVLAGAGAFAPAGLGHRRLRPLPRSARQRRRPPR